MQPLPQNDRRQQMREAFLAAIQEAFERRGTKAASSPSSQPAHEIQLAAALLALSVARADHTRVADEQRAVERALRRSLGLTEDELAMLLRRAEEASGGTAPGLADLATTVAGNLTLAQKKDVVRGLWRIAYADAELHIHEEYLVRKIAHLLGLSSADLVETKLTAREAFLREDL